MSGAFCPCVPLPAPITAYEFDIPFSRQQLADYLAVERSGLSVELCKMRDEGLLEFHKSHFVLKV